MSNTAELRADCTRCAALCCMAPAFDKSESFAIDKPASTPCPKLSSSGACTIHEKREELGFSGCIVYECLGAGQRVTQEVFEGRSWLEEPALKDRMTRAFLAMRKIHELLAMLAAAEALPLDEEERQRMADLQADLNPPEGWSEEALARAPIEEMTARTNMFLRSLRKHVGAGSAP
ncbi:hypothetical protein [Hyphococcus luteus]|uniref:Uncharacterized protein n=1 Tax=Hyphococcus luteus TaxID=2058213 RepID=A0A2S7K2F4_9PROT|nr:hypothetical protein [Marinicaulis flavus]PQA86679.1 hypothetical protein CW354_14375 [Marinicaulis flavus]